MIDPFDILASEYRPMILAYLRSLVKDGHLAEDLTQETFVAAQQGLNSFEEGKNFGRWLRGIARKKALVHWRTQKRKPLLVDSRVIDGVDEVFNDLDRKEEVGEWWELRKKALRDCLTGLSSQLKTAVELVYLEQNSLDEAALALGSNRAAVGQRISRARKGLRECVTRKLKTTSSDE